MAQFGDFVANHWMLVSALVFIITLIVVTELKRKVLGFADIYPQQAVRLMNQEEAIALDVRDDKEFRSGHILNAVHFLLFLLVVCFFVLVVFFVLLVFVFCCFGLCFVLVVVVLCLLGFL